MGWHRSGIAANALLLRTTAAACLCSLEIGWTIGIWGGLTAMPSFSGAFFPRSLPSAASTSSYCLFCDPLLSLGGSIIYIAALPAVAAAAQLTHAYGRKPTMWAIAGASAVGVAVGASAQNLGAVLASRALLGAAMGCSFQAPTMLLAEVLPANQRAAGMYAFNLSMLVGFLASSVANQLLHPYAWGWRVSVALMGLPPLLLAALLPALTESPQALLQRGDGAAAERALAALRPLGADVTGQLVAMRAAAARAAAVPPALSARVRALCVDHLPEFVASALYPLVLMLTGLNVLSSWSPNLLVALGAAPGAALGGNTIIMCCGLAAGLPSVFIVDRIRRRVLLAVGGSLVASTAAALGILLAVYLPGGAGAGAPPPPAWLLPVAVALLCVNRAALACTLQPLAAAVPAEVQPLSIRSDASSLTTGVRNGSSFFVTQFALPLLCATRWGLYLIIAVLTAAGTLALWLLVPETRGIPIEEVHLAWADHWLWGRYACVRAQTGGSEHGAAATEGDGAAGAAATKQSAYALRVVATPA